MQFGKSNGGVLSPKGRLQSAKNGASKKALPKMNKLKSSEFELKGTNDL